MKAQSPGTVCSGGKTRSPGRVRPPAGLQPCQFGAEQPVPAVGRPKDFTLEEHLRVQWEIEQRAHQIWRADGCPANRALAHWLQAESEILAAFVKARTLRHPVRTVATETRGTASGAAAFALVDFHSTRGRFESEFILRQPLPLMNQAMPNLQIHIHKVDGSTMTFVQPDAGEARKILDGFQPTRIFDENRFVIADGHSITSLPVSKITRIDLVSEPLPELVFPAGIVDAVELTGKEFQALVRNPLMREQWKQMSTQDDSLVTFMEVAMSDGEHVFLTTEMHVELQSEELWKTNGFPIAGSSLCFRMRTGGVAVLNLAHLTCLTFFPGPQHAPAGAWAARQFISRQPAAAHLGGGQTGTTVAGSPPRLQVSHLTNT